ncbi:multidrug MFS transporter [Nocardiopsis sp. TSRI0078]|uniref:MFS transporter n=1 Tax=unclassified Nocardiopsis TaxID=2649073 RepID=UPI00093C20F3|nr:MFS transporter [Nocardiopsis sp. TSRI0078]OKI15827.1 multidrug MFS transporter [Nocardiopsis sp. TSRI0078]
MDAQTAYRRRWGGLAVLVICLLVIVADNTILNVALRVLSDPVQGLGASQSQLAWAINSYTLVFAGLLFTFGVLGDRWGRRRLLMLGLAVFGAASALSAYSQSPEQLVLARAVMGFGASMVMPQTLSIITNVFPAEERARAIGIWAGSVGMAMAIGPWAGGLLLENFWWGSIFLINVPFVVLGLALMLVLIPDSRDEDPGRPDVLGVLLSVPGLVLLIYGIITAGERASLADWDVFGALIGGVAVLALFLVHESRTPSPSLDVRFFRDPRFSVSIAIVMVLFFSMAGIIFFLSFYWQSVREFSPFVAGLLVLPAALGQMIMAPLSPTLVRWAGPRVVAAVGVLGVCSCFLFFTRLEVDTPLPLIIGFFFLQAGAMAVVLTPATNAIMSSVPPGRAGAASAVQNTVRQVGTAMGVAVLGAVISFRYRAGITPVLERAAEGEGAADPGELRSAGESIEATMALARRMGEEGRVLVAPAKEAFLSGLHTAATVSLCFGLVGLVVVLVWMPREAGGHRAADEPGERGPAGSGSSGGTGADSPR